MHAWKACISYHFISFHVVSLLSRTSEKMSSSVDGEIDKNSTNTELVHAVANSRGSNSPNSGRAWLWSTHANTSTDVSIYIHPVLTAHTHITRPESVNHHHNQGGKHVTPDLHINTQCINVSLPARPASILLDYDNVCKYRFPGLGLILNLFVVLVLVLSLLSIWFLLDLDTKYDVLYDSSRCVDIPSRYTLFFLGYHARFSGLASLVSSFSQLSTTPRHMYIKYITTRSTFSAGSQSRRHSAVEYTHIYVHRLARSSLYVSLLQHHTRLINLHHPPPTMFIK